MNTVLDVTAAIQAILQQGAPALQDVFRDLPETVNRFPCAVIVPARATLQFPRQPGHRQTDGSIDVHILAMRGASLQAADAALKPFLTTIVDLFDSHVTLNGTCLVAGVSSWAYGVIPYAGTDYCGISYTLSYVLVEEVVFSA